MTSANGLGVNERNVAHDTIDGEVIIVHFINGNYYALKDTAALIWGWLIDGHGVSAIVEHLSRTCQNADPKAVHDFVQQLVDENLLEPREVTRNGDIRETDSGSEFVGPILQKHDDMQALIMLDPIHEVDDAGWPNKPTE